MDFFTREELQTLKEWGGADYNPRKKADQLAAITIRDSIWPKIEFWGQRVLERLSGFEKAKTSKRWLSINSRFKRYAWTRIYKKGKNPHIFFTLSAESDYDSLVCKLHYMFSSTSLEPEQLQYLEENIPDESEWYAVSIESIGNYNWEILVTECVNYINKYNSLYDKLEARSTNINTPGFRLLSIHFEDNHTDTDFSNVHIDFGSNSLENRTSKIDIIIGKNAVGKSRLLYALSKIFNDIHYYYVEAGKFSPAYNANYTIRYSIYDMVYEVQKLGKDFMLAHTANTPEEYQTMLPNKLICFTNGIADHFPVVPRRFARGNQGRTRYSNDMYEYLGGKGYAGATSSYIRLTQTLDLLFTAYRENRLTEEILDLFDLLELAPKIEIEYSGRNIGRLDIFASEETFMTYLSEFYEEQNGFTSYYYKQLRNDSYLRSKLISYAEKIQPEGKVEFSLDFTDLSTFIDFYEDYTYVDFLRKLGILRYNTVYLVDKHYFNRFYLNNASSGQINMFTTFLSILCTISDNSFVMIDEPEANLHPNWQMKFMELFEKVILSKYPRCHVLIATHSHFFLSGHSNDSGSAIILDRSKNGVQAMKYDIGTFGWSAENILYRVFGLSTTRNSYIGNDIGLLLTLLSEQSSDKQKIEELVIRLQSIEIQDGDPLNEVLSAAKQHLNKIN